LTELADLLDSLLAAVAGGGARDEARQVAGELADRAAEDFPTLHTALDLLDYHGELALINEVMARAWIQVQTSAAYSRRAVSAYAGRAGDHLIYTYLESASTSADDFTQLQRDIERYFDVDSGRLHTYLSFLAGEAGRHWGTDDFDELDAAAVSALFVEFAGMARRAGISFGKAHLVREHLPRYFLDRRAGYLHPREDVAALLRHGRRPPPAVSGEPGHPLLPDRLTLRNFLAKMVQIVEPQCYPAAAIVQLAPYWLRFLEVRRLVPGEKVAAAEADLAGLSADLAAAWRESGDPVLLNALLPPNAGSSRRGPPSSSSP
jgi:hypothetical protein